MTSDQMREIFRMILAAYPTQRQRIAAQDVQGMAIAYSAGLDDLEYDVARAAVVRVICISKFIPTIAEIREAVAASGSTLTGADAWGSVVRAMNDKGERRPPGNGWQFVDPITHRIVQSFGWRELCLSENQTADRARFIDAYDAIATSERKRAQASPGAMLPAPATQAAAQLETLASGLAAKLTSGGG